MSMWTASKLRRKASISTRCSIAQAISPAVVNDITLYNRNWQVNVQADARYRLKAPDVGNLKVRNARGEMVPLSTMISIREITGPAIVNHYNLYPSAEVNGDSVPGTSSGQAITLMEEIARRELPSGMGFEWTELTYQQIEASKDLMTKLVFPLAVLFVFMVLAAQYESWSPFRHHPDRADVSAGRHRRRLAGRAETTSSRKSARGAGRPGAKNAILIVEFAKQREGEGLDRVEATVEASRVRLRPILMTSFAFILGVAPLVFAKGAGAEMRVGLGVAVFSGMLGVTLFGLMFTPVFYAAIRRFAAGKTN